MANYFAGRVHSVVFENDAQSFYIMKMTLDGSDTPAVTVRGSVPGISVKAGAWFGFEAVWESHDKYGRQLVIERAPVVRGEWDSETALKMLQGHGVGKRICDALFGHFGDGLIEALGDADKLAEVGILDKFGALHIVSRWRAVRAMFQSLEFLSELKLPKSKVEQIYSHFGDDAEKALSEDPWSLVQIDGISFDQADEVARRLGLNMGSDNRLRGAILYICKARRGMGHLYLTTGEIVKSVQSGAPEVDKRHLARTLKALHDEKLLVLDNKTREGTTAIYEPWFNRLEKESSRMLVERRESAAFDPKERVEYLEKLGTMGPKTEKAAKRKGARLHTVAKSAIREWSGHGSILLSDAQMEGAVNALVEPVSILTGLPGTGKCVVPDTLIGSRGLRPIGEFLPEDLSVDDHRDLVVPIDTSKGVRQTGYVYNGGVQPTVRLTTTSGYALEGTFEHPIRVVEDGAVVWKKLGDLDLKSIPVLVRGGYSFGVPSKLPPLRKGDSRERRYRASLKMGDRLAQLLGYLVSEGTTTNFKTLTVTHHDHRVQQLIKDTTQHLFGYEGRDQHDSRLPGQVVGIQVHSIQLRKWFADIGIGYGDAYDKEVPWSILQATKKEIRSFLRALFEGDGTVSGDRFSVEYGSRSERLATQVHLLLLAFGVVSSLRVEQRECHPSAPKEQQEKKPWFRISLYGEDYDRFREQIGFDFKKAPPRTSESNTNRHLIYAKGLINILMEEVKPTKGHDYNLFYRYAKGKGPHARRPSRTHLEKLLKMAEPSETTEALRSLMRPEFFYDTVRSLKHGESQVVDFGVPEGHEFLSNGFISHNTATLKVVVKVLQDAGIPFLLVAPTGIAAKRLSSVTGADASTIHRAFGAKGMGTDNDREATYAGIVGDSGGLSTEDGSTEFWSYSSKQPHPARVVIVDESSMVDQHLLFRLLSCTTQDCRLVFVGDAAQLPSVGPGNVLRDIISCGEFPVVDLREIFRQHEASDIVIAAHAINSGEMPKFKEKSLDFTFAEVRDEHRILETLTATVRKLYERKINFQVLSPRHAGTLGVTNLNLRIRELLNPKTPGLKEMRLGPETVREGDRVMVSKNNYRYEIFNGDVGKVVRLDQKEKFVEIKIHGPPVMHVQMPFKEAPTHLRMAYCVTVHKCIHPDTLIETGQGIICAGDADEEGVVGTAEGPKKYTKMVKNPPLSMLKITTDDGYEITVTPDHGLDVWDTGTRKYVRREAASVCRKDFLRLRMGPGIDSEVEPTLPEAPRVDVRATLFRFPETLTGDVAEFLGLMVADGTLYRKGFRLAKRHIEVVDRFSELANTLFGAVPRRFRENGAYQAEVNSVQLSCWLRKVGGMGAHAKDVPSCVMRAPLKIQKRFMRGLFEDGSVNPRTNDSSVLDHVEWSSVFPKLLQKARLLLLRMGVICGSSKPTSRVPSLYIYGQNARRFGEVVGFITKMKQELCQLVVGNETHYVLPIDREVVKGLRRRFGKKIADSTYKNGVNRQRMSRHTARQLLEATEGPSVERDLLEELFQDHHSPVAFIEEVVAPSVCLEVPEGHQFLQNGFRGWNSQGQEYDVILIPWVNSFRHQLQRNLIYTAITRARKKVILVGHPEALEKAIRNNKVDTRNTLFPDRLRAIIG